jgi:hypothetical protein
MKVIQSWFDYRGKKKLSDYEAKVAELSRMTLEHHLDTEITLYTNLEDTSNLNYKHIKPLSAGESSSYISWILGKLEAMVQQTEPFLHIDMDVFLFKKTNMAHFYRPFMVLHHEYWAQQFSKYAHLVPAPKSLSKGYDWNHSNNFGIVGGTNWKDITECMQEILDHIYTRKDELHAIYSKYHNKDNAYPAVLTEQVWTSEMMFKRKILPTSFLRYRAWNPVHNELQTSARLRGLAHFWCNTKEERKSDIEYAYKKWKDYLKKQ